MTTKNKDYKAFQMEALTSKDDHKHLMSRHTIYCLQNLLSQSKENFKKRVSMIIP